MRARTITWAATVIMLYVHAAFAGATTAPTTKPALPPANAALSRAIKTGDVELVKKMIADGVPANSAGTSPLWSASVYHRTEIAKVLLDAGANPDSRESSCEITALRVAAADNNPEMAELLLRAGAKQELNVCLSLAARRGSRKLVILFLDAGADPNWKYEDGTTAIDDAAKRHPDIADMMRRYKPAS